MARGRTHPTTGFGSRMIRSGKRTMGISGSNRSKLPQVLNPATNSYRLEQLASYKVCRLRILSERELLDRRIEWSETVQASAQFQRQRDAAQLRLNQCDADLNFRMLKSYRWSISWT
jgi:hypothetical protein